VIVIVGWQIKASVAWRAQKYYIETKYIHLHIHTNCGMAKNFSEI
jgi:hypothetical protein